jgi:UDP-N-acetylglucosamine diphosphorylase/glucosamine-1-phosphate N-acetyltransferase
MSRIVLFEDDGYRNMLPLTYWRTVPELRAGRKILIDRTAQRLDVAIAGVWTRPWLAAVAQHRCGAPVNQPVTDQTILTNARWIMEDRVSFPPGPCVGMIDSEIAFIVCDEALAGELQPEDLILPQRQQQMLQGLREEAAPGWMVRYPWDILGHLPELLEADWSPSEAGCEADLDPRLCLIAPERIGIGPGSRVHPTAVLDATEGPIYISHDVQIGAQAVVEGPAYLGPGCKVNPHAWLHGANALGPVCKVGGELDGCVFYGYSNKQHDGFLGHAYVGSWVNLGAGTVNSDLKNTYGSVRVPLTGTEIDSGRTFMGAVIGDHVKTAINTTLPTGAVLGFAAVVATGRILPKFVPSFSWVTEDGTQVGDPARLLEVATRVMARRDVNIMDEEVELFLELEQLVKDHETA